MINKRNCPGEEKGNEKRKRRKVKRKWGNYGKKIKNGNGNEKWKTKRVKNRKRMREKEKIGRKKV